MNKLILLASLLLAALVAYVVYSQTVETHCHYVIPGISGTFCKQQDAEKGVYYTNGKIEVRVL